MRKGRSGKNGYATPGSDSVWGTEWSWDRNSNWADSDCGSAQGSGDERTPNQVAKAERSKAAREAKRKDRKKKKEEPGASAVEAGMQGDFDSGINVAVAGDAARVAGTRLPRPVDRGEGPRVRSDTPGRTD